MDNNDRIAGWAAAGLAAVASSALVAVSLTPRPTVAVIKALFERGGAAMAGKMRPHVPDDVRSEYRIAYGTDDPDTVLSIHRPAGATGPLPVVLWIHGGGWVSGSNADVDPYLAILAARCGVVTVAVEYSQGPKAVYPRAVAQICDALAHLTDHADELDIDIDRIMLAGDSAGAQLASQIAAMVTNPAYADEVGLVPPISADQLCGVMLHCGVFDLNALSKAPGLIGWAVGQVIWAYTGHQGERKDVAVRQMSTIHAVTADFPPTLISGGNADPLTSNQSQPFAARLAALGVRVDTYFVADDYQPALNHEFQFDLDGVDGQQLLVRGVAFIGSRFAVVG